MNERRHFQHFAGICGIFGFVEGGLSVFHFSCPCIIHERRHFRDFPGNCGCFAFVGGNVQSLPFLFFVLHERTKTKTALSRQLWQFRVCWINVSGLPFLLLGAWHTFVQLRALLRRDSCRSDLAPFVAVSRLGFMLSCAENRNRTCVEHRTDVALVTITVVISSGANSLLNPHSCQKERNVCFQ